MYYLLSHGGNSRTSGTTRVPARLAIHFYAKEGTALGGGQVWDVIQSRGYETASTHAASDPIPNYSFRWKDIPGRSKLKDALKYAKHVDDRIIVAGSAVEGSDYAVSPGELCTDVAKCNDNVLSGGVHVCNGILSALERIRLEVDPHGRLDIYVLACLPDVDGEVSGDSPLTRAGASSSDEPISKVLKRLSQKWLNCMRINPERAVVWFNTELTDGQRNMLINDNHAVREWLTISRAVNYAQTAPVKFYKWWSEQPEKKRDLLDGSRRTASVVLMSRRVTAPWYKSATRKIRKVIDDQIERLLADLPDDVAERLAYYDGLDTVDREIVDEMVEELGISYVDFRAQLERARGGPAPPAKEVNPKLHSAAKVANFSKHRRLLTVEEFKKAYKKALLSAVDDVALHGVEGADAQRSNRSLN